MKLRVIDYIGNPGGGLRFTGQLLKALQTQGRGYEIEFVSHGEALSRYRAVLGDAEIACRILDIPPRPHGRQASFTGHDVQPAIVSDCDIAWFPWIHFHRLDWGATRHVVGSFHDGLLFTEPTLLGNIGKQEQETVKQWLASPATLICSSQFWKNRLSEIFALQQNRLRVVPLSGRHAPPKAKGAVPTQRWKWLSSPYLLYPANTTRHKNHEVLFEGLAKSKLTWPLVLTGSGSNLRDGLSLWARLRRCVGIALGRPGWGRAAALRSHAKALGLTLGEAIIPLGHMEDADYDAVLEHAACLVMPTLGEGGGSFPVEEALLRGVPVICSDIPVLREQMTRLGAEVIWFNPQQSTQLACKLTELQADYPRIKAAAEGQKARLNVRTWSNVANEYASIFSLLRPA